MPLGIHTGVIVVFPLHSGHILGHLVVVRSITRSVLRPGEWKLGAEILIPAYQGGKGIGPIVAREHHSHKGGGERLKFPYHARSPSAVGYDYRLAALRKHFEHFLLLGGQIEVLPVSRSLTVALLSYAGDDNIAPGGSLAESLEVGRLLLIPVVSVFRGIFHSRTIAHLTREPALQGLQYRVVWCGLTGRPVSLPGVGPASVDAAHGIGVGTAYEYLLPLPQRQHSIVFEQHFALDSRPVRAGFELRGSEIVVCLRIPDRMLEEAEAHLQAQHAAHRIIYPFHRHGSLLDQFLEVYAELPGGRDHSHIYSRIDGKPHRVLFACGHTVTVVQVVDVVPVGDYHTVPVQVFLEPDREQLPVGVERYAVVGR